MKELIALMSTNLAIIL